MKLLHVIGTLGAGGAERFVVHLLCELRRRGWEVGLIATSARTDAAGRRMRVELSEGEVPLLSGPTESVRLRSMLWYVSQMRSLRPELVHLHNINTETFQMFVPPRWRPKLGLVRTVHVTNLDTKDMDGFSLRTNDVAYNIFCSEASAKGAEGLTRGPSRVVPYGVRSEQPARTTQASNRAKARLCLAAGILHFLHVGRLSGDDLRTAQKAHDVLLRSWLESGVGRSGALLHLLGDGNLRGRLTALAGGDPSICFHGVRPDVPDWLLAADCFVMPSRYEGLPVAAIEAVTAGLPCLFSRIAPLVELSAPFALWCDVDDVASLARNLAEFAAHPREVDPAAITAARERFDIAHAADGYAEVYQTLGLRPSDAAGARESLASLEVGR